MDNCDAGHGEHGAYLTNWIPYATNINIINEEGYFETHIEKVSGKSISYKCTCGKHRSSHKHIWKPVYGYKDIKKSSKIWIPEYLPWNETHWDSRIWIECMNCHKTFNSQADWEEHRRSTLLSSSPHLACSTLSERTTKLDVIKHPGTGHYKDITQIKKERYIKYYECPLCDKRKPVES